MGLVHLVFPGGIGRQVGGPLKQDGEHVVQLYRTAPRAEETVAGVGESVEFQLQAPEPGDRVLRQLSGGHQIHQVRQFPQPHVDILPGVGGTAEHFGVELKGQGQSRHGNGENDQLQGDGVGCGRPHLQEYKHHGVGKIALRIKLGAVDEHQQEGHRKVQ